ncbi:MAG: heme exporter protein CcmB [Neomegalonema sp.]|nr:heme exporter protein CcmB [Neomegalonema sp.]
MRALFLRDLRLALRLGGGAGLSLSFFFIVAAVIGFSVEPDPKLLAQVGPGAVLIATALAALISLDRLFQADFEDGSLEQIALGPAPLEAAVLSKAAAHWATTGLPATLCAPLLAQMFQVPDAATLTLTLALAVGAPALSLTGAVGAALTLGVRRGGLLLSVIVAPMFSPTLILGAVAARAAALQLDPSSALLLLAAITIGALAIAPFAAAAALRINVN